MEAVSGLRLDDSRQVVGVSWEDQDRMRTMVESLPMDDYYARIAKWYYGDPESRPITPFSKLTPQR